MGFSFHGSGIIFGKRSAMAKSRKVNLSKQGMRSASDRPAASPASNGEEEEEERNELRGDRFHDPQLGPDVPSSGPGGTPAPSWKVYENRSCDVFSGAGAGAGAGRRKRGKRNGVDDNDDDGQHNVHLALSARKLAAVLWQQQPGTLKRVRERRGIPISNGIRRVQRGQRAFQPFDAYVESHYSSKLVAMGSNSHRALQRQKDGRISLSTSAPTNDTCLEVDSVQQPAAISNAGLEKATKWDSGDRNTSADVFKVYNCIKISEEQQTMSVSVVSALKKELFQARLLVHELEHAQKSSRKEVDRFLRKIAEERGIWQGKEQERIKAMIRTMKEELHNERKEKRKMEMLNGKLAKELAEAKITIMRSLQDLEKERKARQLMEDVCDELAREIGEDKAQVEELKLESIKVREEVEEERKMLQMAEVWREERVQMKLIEAKLALEEKSSALDKLREDLEAFINSKMTSQGSGTASVAAADMQDAELLREAASSIQVQDIKEFSYQPPNSEDIFSAFGDLNPFKVNNETSDARNGWDLEDGCYSPRSHTSKILTVTPESHGFNRNSIRSHQDIRIGEEEGHTHAMEEEEQREEESDWEQASQSEGDEQESSTSPRESKTSLNGDVADGSYTESGTDWEENEDSAIVITEIDSYPTKEGPLKTKSLPAGQLWRPNSGKEDRYKTIPAENNFPARTKSSIPVTSPGQQCVDGAYSPSNLGTWSSPDASNPRIARGIKGFIEWPRGIQKNSLKAKLLEAKMESQKAQLRHVLKQRH